MTNPCTDSTLAPLILVDAYSTGALLAQALAEHRPLLHVRSRNDMPPAFAASCPQTLFRVHYGVHEEGLEPLLEKLAAQAPAAVLTGSEFVSNWRICWPPVSACPVMIPNTLPSVVTNH